MFKRQLKIAVSLVIKSFLQTHLPLAGVGLSMKTPYLRDVDW